MNDELIFGFEPIDLEELDRVQLMKRVDNKFLVAANKIPLILQGICKYYYILEINNERLQRYHTSYFDTEDNRLYISHHNGKLNRYKVRKRTYVDTKTSFLEVKFKSNKGKTIKQRIPCSGDDTELCESEKEFLWNIFPLSPDGLRLKSVNQFRRITLVDKDFTERCTMDFELRFTSKGHTVEHQEFVVVELKQDKYNHTSKLHHILMEHRIKPTGFSKYCMGRVLVEDDLKTNLFKNKIRTLNKLIHN